MVCWHWLSAAPRRVSKGDHMMNESANDGLGVEEIIGDKRDQVLKLARKHGAYNIRVFGSVARGDARPDSDVDFLVEWNYDQISSWGGAGLFLELETLLGHSVDIATEKQLRPHIRARVLEESVEL